MKMISPSASPTVLINTIAQQKIASGIKIYNLSAGEPKLSPHKLIIQSLTELLQHHNIFYPPTDGLPELKTLASHYMNEIYQCDYSPKNTLIVNGGKFGIYLLLQLLLKKSDEVIFASPYWVSYPAITSLFYGNPIIISTQQSQQWKITVKDIEKVMTPKSKILILNNACNPTGTLYTHNELKKILAFAADNHLFVISDEVYSGLVYDKKSFVSGGSFRQFHHNIAVIQSCSKNFAMTGWRIGFVFAEEFLIKQLSSLVSQSTSGVPIVSQWAAISALKHAKKINGWVNAAMQKNRDALMKALQKYFHISLKSPESALYVFVSLKSLGVKKHNDSRKFCEDALEYANIAMVPGDAFGRKGFIRISFGTSATQLKTGIKLLAAFIKNRY